MQFIRDLREVTGALKELVADDARHEDDAKLELAVSAQRFSQETREVVDDTLSFSATLMRAGEVAAAAPPPPRRRRGLRARAWRRGSAAAPGCGGPARSTRPPASSPRSRPRSGTTKPPFWSRSTR